MHYLILFYFGAEEGYKSQDRNFSLLGNYPRPSKPYMVRNIKSQISWGRESYITSLKFDPTLMLADLSSTLLAFQ